MRARLSALSHDAMIESLSRRILWSKVLDPSNLGALSLDALGRNLRSADLTWLEDDDEGEGEEGTWHQMFFRNSHVPLFHAASGVHTTRPKDDNPTAYLELTAKARGEPPRRKTRTTLSASKISKTAASISQSLSAMLPKPPPPACPPGREDFSAGTAPIYIPLRTSKASPPQWQFNKSMAQKNRAEERALQEAMLVRPKPRVWHDLDDDEWYGEEEHGEEEAEMERDEEAARAAAEEEARATAAAEAEAEAEAKAETELKRKRKKQKAIRAAPAIAEPPPTQPAPSPAAPLQQSTAPPPQTTAHPLGQEHPSPAPALPQSSPPDGDEGALDIPTSSALPSPSKLPPSRPPAGTQPPATPPRSSATPSIASAAAAATPQPNGTPAVTVATTPSGEPSTAKATPSKTLPPRTPPTFSTATKLATAGVAAGAKQASAAKSAPNSAWSKSSPGRASARDSARDTSPKHEPSVGESPKVGRAGAPAISTRFSFGTALTRASALSRAQTAFSGGRQQQPGSRVRESVQWQRRSRASPRYREEASCCSGVCKVVCLGLLLISPVLVLLTSHLRVLQAPPPPLPLPAPLPPPPPRSSPPPQPPYP